MAPDPKWAHPTGASRIGDRSGWAHPIHAQGTAKGRRGRAPATIATGGLAAPFPAEEEVNRVSTRGSLGLGEYPVSTREYP